MIFFLPPDIRVTGVEGERETSLAVCKDSDVEHDVVL